MRLWAQTVKPPFPERGMEFVWKNQEQAQCAEKKKARTAESEERRCNVNIEDFAERLSRYGMLDWYEYQDMYWGREDEYTKEIYQMLGGPGSMDMTIADIEGFLEEAEDWAAEDFRAWGMHKAETISIVEDLKRHRRCFS